MRNSLINNILGCNRYYDINYLNTLKNEHLLRLCNPMDRKFYYDKLNIFEPYEYFKQKYDSPQELGYKNRK